MDGQDFCTAGRLNINPGKILLIGTMGSGKTTVAERLAQDFGFPFTSIDSCRIRYGDGSIPGENTAWDHFLAICASCEPAILEFSGCGPHADEVRDALRESGTPVTIIWLVVPLDKCLSRAQQRKKNIPAPFLWAPLEYGVPAIHEAVEGCWERIWTSEPSFHPVQLAFSGKASAVQLYSAVRKICSFP